MPGLKELKTIYENAPEKIESFLVEDAEVIVSEKLDAYRFSFEKQKGKLIFYKRNDKEPIDKIDRVLNDLYEKAITYFNSLDKSIIKFIPENLRFGFAYFPNKKPLRIEYNKLPKNNLALTDITQRDKTTQKVVKVYENIAYLNRWANTLSVGEVPIIYKGKLKSEQITFIKEILNGSDKINAQFSEHIKAVFGKIYTNNSIIEGIVIKTPEGIAQLKDPSFELFELHQLPKENRDFYDLILLELHNYLEKKGLPQHLSKIDSDERYIECVSEIFNNFIVEANINKNSDPKYLEPNIIGSKGRLGKKFINNNKTRELIESNPFYEQLFKVFINTLRRKRKPYGLLNENTVYSLNKFIEDISVITNTNIIENYVKGYNENINEIEDIENEDVDSKDKKEQVDTDFLQQNIVDILLPKPKKSELNTDNKNPLNIFISNFNPINNTHLEKIKECWNNNKSKTILVNLNIEKQIGESWNWYIDSNLSDKIVDAFANQNSKYIIGYLFLSTNLLSNISIYLNKHQNIFKDYFIDKLIIDDEQFEFYKIQNEWIKTKIDINTEKNIKFDKFYDKNEYKILKTLQDNQANTFKEYVPNSVAQFWELIYRDWFNWANK